jgi:hypothetical protein
MSNDAGTAMAADGASGAAGLAFAAKYGLFAKLGALLAAGAVGAVLIAAVDPAEAMPDPKKRRKLIFTQVVAAGVVCGGFGPLAVRWLGRADGWFPVAASDVGGWVELAMPVGLVLGGLSWGLIGATVKLRQLIAARGASAIADRVGIKETP